MSGEEWFFRGERNGMQLENGKNPGIRRKGLGMGLEASEDWARREGRIVS